MKFFYLGLLYCLFSCHSGGIKLHHGCYVAQHRGDVFKIKKRENNYVVLRNIKNGDLLTVHKNSIYESTCAGSIIGRKRDVYEESVRLTFADKIDKIDSCLEYLDGNINYPLIYNYTVGVEGNVFNTSVTYLEKYKAKGGVKHKELELDNAKYKGCLDKIVYEMDFEKPLSGKPFPVKQIISTRTID